jgi:hypothetical protein
MSDRLDVISDDCMMRLHAAVVRVMFTSLKQYPDEADKVTAAMIAALVHELMSATAAANVVCGRGEGLKLTHKLLSVLNDGVLHRTIRLQHEIDEMMAEGWDGQ